MVYLNLHLTSNDKTFEYYSFPIKILNKNYEIAMIKLDGQINNSNLESKLLLNNINLNVVIDKNNNILASNIDKEKNNKKTIPNTYVVI